MSRQQAEPRGEVDKYLRILRSINPKRACYSLLVKIIFLNAWGGKMGKEMRSFFKLHAPDTDLFCLQEATDPMRRMVREYLRDFSEILHVDGRPSSREDQRASL